MKILVWEDKHGTSYYDASTPEALEKSAVMVIKTLVDNSYIYEPSSEMPVLGEAALLTNEEIDALPDAIRESTRADVEKAQKKYARKVKAYTEERTEWAHANAFINGEKVTRMGTFRNRETDEVYEKEVMVSAWEFIDSRNGWEYENYNIETVITHEEN